MERPRGDANTAGCHGRFSIPLLQGDAVRTPLIAIELLNCCPPFRFSMRAPDEKPILEAEGKTKKLIETRSNYGVVPNL